MSSAPMRGLTVFISDIRNCTSKEQEKKRVDKELAHIRAKFGSKNLDGYDKKKYVWKLCYISLLGYPVEIGHMEALQLLSSNKFSEKSAGYIACSIFFNEEHELLRLIIQSIKKDLTKEPINEINQCLALSTIANVGGREFAEALTSDVQSILLSPTSRSFVKKKAALAMLRLIRKYPDVIPTGDFPQRVVNILENDDDIGVATSVMSLILGLISHSTQGYEDVVPKAIQLLGKLLHSKDRLTKYRYYLTFCPWLQIKCLRVLQYFPPPSDRALLTRLNQLLGDIFTRTQMTKNVNKNNADHAILFEAIHLIIAYTAHGVTDLYNQAVSALGRFIQYKEPNYRYLGLEIMARCMSVDPNDQQIKKHQNTILHLLKDPDVSIRKRALDLLFLICDKQNAGEIVPALLQYLPTSSYEMREELVLKIAILAEKYASDLRWYVDVILQLISHAGDFVYDEIWHRVVQIVTNNEVLQDYAATTCAKFLENPSVHENGVKVGAYIIGEFGHKISDKSITGESLFELLLSKLKTSSNTTKAILFNAFIKMANTYPQLKPRVDQIFATYRGSVDLELQQRACEYLALSTRPGSEDLMNKVFEVMPDFVVRKSALEKKVKAKAKATVDRNLWDPETKQERKREEEEDEEDEEEEEEDEGEQVEGVPGRLPAAPGGPSPTAAAAQQQSTAAPLEILAALEASLAGPTAPASASPVAATTGATPATGAAGPVPLADLFGAPSFPPVEGKVDPFPLPEQPHERVLAILRKEQPSGVLYETNQLQIGYKAQFEQGFQCKMVLYWGNKTALPIQNISVTLPESEALKVQVKPAEAFEAPAGQQTLQYFLWTCKRPFSEIPALHFSFVYQGERKSFTLRIPILMSSFFLPTPVAQPADFLAEWKANVHEVISVRKLPSIANLEDLKQWTTKAMHFALVEGVDPSPTNFCAKATFYTATKDPAGNPVNMPCYLRVETKPGMNIIRVSVRSPHPQVTAGLLHSVATTFAADPA